MCSEPLQHYLTRPLVLKVRFSGKYFLLVFGLAAKTQVENIKGHYSGEEFLLHIQSFYVNSRFRHCSKVNKVHPPVVVLHLIICVHD